MHYLKLTTIILFVLSCAAYGISVFVYKKDVDTTPPVITAEMDLLEVSVKDDQRKLYEGLTAMDDKDGDITDRIMISGESYFMSANECSIRYLVFDAAHNSAVYKRTIRYTDYTPPRFSLDQPLIYTVGSNMKFMDEIKAADCIDGDITGKIRMLSSSISNYMEGVYPAKFEVMNTHGQKATVDVNILVTAESYEPTVQLKEYITYVKQGSGFDPYALIEHATNQDGKKLDHHVVRVNGIVKTDTPGTYTLFYSTSSDDSLKGTYLSVVVEEAHA